MGENLERIHKYVTEMSGETYIEDNGASTGSPLRRHDKNRRRIMSGNGQTLSQEDSTKVVWKYRN